MKPLRSFRRIALLIAFLVFITSFVLLLNITAPNPTRRRYSSEVPLTTGQARPEEIGLDAERILSKDLGVPRNDLPTERNCFCNPDYQPFSQLYLSECRTCMVYAQLTGPFRRPDFVTDHYIAESKNTQNMLYEFTDRAEQIEDYVLSARALNRPLWLYVRVNTTLSREFYDLVNSTGGGVVHYFAVPGWEDPIDQTARSGLLLGAVGLAILGLAEWLSRRPAKPRASGPRPRSTLDKAIDSVEEARRFQKSVKDSTRDKLD